MRRATAVRLDPLPQPTPVPAPREGSPPRPAADPPPHEVPGSVDEALAAAADWSDLPHPGGGATVRLWEALATLGAADLEVARAVEPHLDARAVLHQAETAGHPVDLPAVLRGPGTTWGVFAAEGPGVRLDAVPGTGGWTLTGTKPWCSLGDRLDAALVTAHLPDGGRGLFAVALRHPGVRTDGTTWAARGLVGIPSTPLVLGAVPAAPVGPPGWYLERPGFWWGGLGVAACWFGGTVGLARRLHAHAAGRGDDPLTHLALGTVDRLVQDGRRALAEAAVLVDASGADPGSVGRDEGSRLARRVRATVARGAEGVLSAVAHGLGPAPLTQEAEHAQRVADLEVYVRQEHAERDAVALGRSLAAGPAPW
ncbi:acyl-CoA dehydrogenase [Cellulomonas endophytica]|uniref:acyl-CoA dehydrogenase n=1 Tax=Cellulomonas endophytica TaxID=2494735 RepID=UPI001F0BF03D|nr:acyl-CoA dehydrogenase [Cellulomonas endophytica]